MPFKISDPVVQEFTLPKTDLKYGVDDSDPTTVMIRQARQHEHAVRQDQWSKFERRYSNANPDEVKIIQELSFEAIKMLEAYMVLVGSNILAEDGETELFPSKKDGKGHLKLEMTKLQFEKAWGSLNSDVAEEIHQKILEVNPMWGGVSGE